MDALKRLHNLHKKTLMWQVGIQILKVRLIPSSRAATKNKRPHCCQHCASAVRQCKRFKDSVSNTALTLFIHRWKLQDVLGRSEPCRPLCVLGAATSSVRSWKQVFPRHTRPQRSRTILSLSSFSRYLPRNHRVADIMDKYWEHSISDHSLFSPHFLAFPV